MMKNKFLSKILLIFVLVMCLFAEKTYVSASIAEKIQKVEYSDAYKKWLQLSDEEKSKVLQPRMYDVINSQSNKNYLKSINNVLKTSQLLKSTLSNDYSLQNIIPKNMIVRNQMSTSECWAFATLRYTRNKFSFT